jgi:hypothetical protein
MSKSDNDFFELDVDIRLSESIDNPEILRKENKMIIVKNKDGFAVSKSKNLQGLKRYVSKKELPHKVFIYESRNGSANVRFRFPSGNYVVFYYDSLIALKILLRNWRNLYGIQVECISTISFTIENKGTIGYYNEYLMSL